MSTVLYRLLFLLVNLNRLYVSKLTLALPDTLSSISDAAGARCGYRVSQIISTEELICAARSVLFNNV